jgi:stage III sporulation protein AC
MGVDLIFKIAAIGILVIILNSLLESSNRKEIALMVSLAGLVIILLMVVKEISVLFNTVKTLFNLS